MSDKTPFEQWMKNSLEGYQAPYDPSAWEGIEQELDRMEASDNSPRSRNKGQRLKKWSAWAAGGTALIIAGALLFPELRPDREEGSPERTTSQVEAQEGISGKKAEEAKDPELRSVPEEGADRKEVSEKGNAPASDDLTDKKSSAQTAKVEEGTADPGKKASEKGPNDLKESQKAQTKGNVEEPIAKEKTPQKENPEKNGSDGVKERLPGEIGIRANRTEGCPPLEVSLSPSERPEGVDYLWDLGNGQYSNKAEPTLRYDEAGEYNITLTLTDRRSGETLTRTKKAMINVHEPPKGRIVELEERGLRKPRPITAFRIEDRENVQEIVWQLGDGTRIEGQERVEHRYPSKGAYSVRALLKGGSGCSDTLRYNYEQQKSYDLLAPDAFSPNGDGRNDDFIPEALKVLDVPFTMTIHDRSGKVVYKTNSADDPWNGRVQNSSETVDAGSTFLWVVVLENERGEEESYKGHVTVVK